MTVTWRLRCTEVHSWGVHIQQLAAGQDILSAIAGHSDGLGKLATDAENSWRLLWQHLTLSQQLLLLLRKKKMAGGAMPHLRDLLVHLESLRRVKRRIHRNHWSCQADRNCLGTVFPLRCSTCIRLYRAKVTSKTFGLEQQFPFARMKNWKRYEISMESMADVADPTKIFTSAFNAFYLLGPTEHLVCRRAARWVELW